MVATFAPLTASQDVATFVRAAKQVYDVRLGACQFLVVGEGPEETGLRKLARELKLEKHLTFAHAEVPQDRILPDVDVYVQTARQEAFGLGVLAAMAWGRPVVAASAGALIGLVEDGRTGCLVPPGDPDAFAEKILELLSDARRRAELGRQGRNRAEARYQLDAMLEGTLHIYGEARGLLTPSASGSTIARLLLK
ncbi:MAG: glycosyltransferase [Planctomycetota bacterium]|nr:glycosyltransferase [Planctomycetota bacterium]